MDEMAKLIIEARVAIRRVKEFIEQNKIPICTIGLEDMRNSLMLMEGYAACVFEHKLADKK